MAGRERRKRKRRDRRPRETAAVAPAPSVPAAPAPPRKSKDDIAREQLEPLREGERPLAVTIAAAVSALLDVGWIVAIALGESGAVAGLPFAILLAIAAVGLWRSRYWAVLGFQVMLVLTLVNAMLFLVLKANAVLDVVVAVAILALAGTLFWFLIRAMARIQMPERRPRDATN
jgi:hypothetical protein